MRAKNNQATFRLASISCLGTGGDAARCDDDARSPGMSIFSREDACNFGEAHCSLPQVDAFVDGMRNTRIGEFLFNA